MLERAKRIIFLNKRRQPTYVRIITTKNSGVNSYKTQISKVIEMHSSQRPGDQQRQSRRSSANSIQSNPMEQIYEMETCTDPNCEENIAYNERQRQQREHENNRNRSAVNNNEKNSAGSGSVNGSGGSSSKLNHGSRKSSIDSAVHLLATNMTSHSSEEQLLNDDCTADCQRCSDIDEYENGACGGGGNDRERHENASNNQRGNGNEDFCDPLINRSNNYYDNETHSYGQELSSQDDFYSNQASDYNQQQRRQQQQDEQLQTLPPEVISNKSSKVIYKDLAKQYGITCKMSDGCRCMECQSHYFDCGYDDNEQQKTDGGLGAGTPMFISEVMHGSACQIL